MNDIRLNLPANWTQLNRHNRIRLISEIVPHDFEQLPVAERGRIESALVYATLQMVDPAAAWNQLIGTLKRAERMVG